VAVVDVLPLCVCWDAVYKSTSEITLGEDTCLLGTAQWQFLLRCSDIEVGAADFSTIFFDHPYIFVSALLDL